MAYLVLLLASSGLVLSLVALVGVWWHGKINPDLFGGAIQGRGSLSLWDFTTSADLLGIRLPQTFMSLDSSTCAGHSPVFDTEEMCSKLHAIRGLVISSVVFMSLTLLAATGALFAAGGCCRGNHKVRSQLTTSFLSVASFACMLGALAVGASADTAHMMKEFGGMGSAFYCAVAQVFVGLLLANISCLGGSAPEMEPRPTARRQFGASQGTEVLPDERGCQSHAQRGI